MSERLRQVAKSVLPRSILDWLRKHRRHGGPSRSASRRSTKPPRGNLEQIAALASRLWSSGLDSDYRSLAAAVKLEAEHSEARARGILALARWHLSRGDVELALDELGNIDAWSPNVQRDMRLLRVDALCSVGRGREAWVELSRLVGRSSDDHDLTLRSGYANSVLDHDSSHGSGAMVESLNLLYGSARFALIRRHSVRAAVGLGNLVCDAEPAEPQASLPKVTAVTWLDEGIDSLGLRSLLEQTWVNLEVIVLTRHGADGQWPVRCDDPRIVRVSDPIHLERPMRAAVAIGKGQFVLVHPPHIWSHPQRLEAQVGALIQSAEQFGNVCSRLQVGEMLAPRPLGKSAQPGLVGPHPDLMVLRADGGVTGCEDRWRLVRRHYSADTGTLGPIEGLGRVADHVPLCLAGFQRLSSSEETS